MIMAHGESELPALQNAMAEMNWKPDTCAELDRVRMVIRRIANDGT
jgi:hypothetical protein